MNPLPGSGIETIRPQNPGHEEINVLQILFILWDFRKWVIGGTVAFTLVGVLYALLATPVYYSQATIALKETGKNGGGAAGILSQLGGMGGMVAAQLGIGNTSLDKMEIILKGHDLAESVIQKNGLLPALFSKDWDAKKGRWKDSLNAPTLRDGIEKLQENVLVVRLDVKKNIIKVGIKISDSLFSKQLVEFYLTELNERIRSDAMRDAETNREYLEKQMMNSRDPVLVEKIQNMVAFEIEKYMLVSSQAFEVLERPIVPMKRESPKRKRIVVISFLLGALISTGSALIWRGLVQSMIRTHK